MPLTGATLKPTPLHIVAFIAVIAGFGFTFTVIVKVAPVQLPKATDDVGVTVYIAVCAVVVVLASVPFMFVPLPDAPPVKPVPAGADHE